MALGRPPPAFVRNTDVLQRLLPPRVGEGPWWGAVLRLFINSFLPGLPERIYLCENNLIRWNQELKNV